MLTPQLPTLVSFFAGDDYYFEASKRLRSDCERLGMAHHIEELPAEGLDWGQICRLKIAFYRRMHDLYGAILWMDVDNRLLAIPEELRECGFDIAGFSGRFRYIRDYDPFEQTRFWVPSIFYFGDTSGASDFIDLMGLIERSTDEPVTDDWVLHEAWLRHDGQLSVGFLPPKLVARDADKASPEHVFYCGSSGNVKKFVNGVVQHERRVNTPSVRSRILGAEAAIAMKQGERLLAVELASRAYYAFPDDPHAVIRYSRYLKMTRRSDEAIQVLDGFLSDQSDAVRVREEIIKRLSEARYFESAEGHFEILNQSDDPLIIARLKSNRFEFEMERRADANSISDADRPRVWWDRTPYPGNFGDVVGPWLIEKVSGIPPKFGRRDRSMLSTGDLIQFATPKSIVWGSGLSSLRTEIEPAARYGAVRGPITRARIIKFGGSCPAVYGDPALLLPRYLEKPIELPKNKLGLVRRLSENAMELYFDGVSDIRLDGVGEESFVDLISKICDCEQIISTSLYGIILANAYGIPARWIELEDSHNIDTDGSVEFDDYFMSVDVKPQRPFIIKKGSIINEKLSYIVDKYVDINFDADRLIEAYTPA